MATELIVYNNPLEQVMWSGIMDLIAGPAGAWMYVVIVALVVTIPIHLALDELMTRMILWLHHTRHDVDWKQWLWVKTSIYGHMFVSFLTIFVGMLVFVLMALPLVSG